MNKFMNDAEIVRGAKLLSDVIVQQRSEAICKGEHAGSAEEMCASCRDGAILDRILEPAGEDTLAGGNLLAKLLLTLCLTAGDPVQMAWAMRIAISFGFHMGREFQKVTELERVAGL